MEARSLSTSAPCKTYRLRSRSYSGQKASKSLTKKDIPVLAKGKFGKGSVIFSGFNLPYHIVNYQNEEEAKLLKNIILSLVPESLAIGEFSVNWTDPTLIVASATDAKGIYFKQNYHPGWKAAVNGKKTQVLNTG